MSPSKQGIERMIASLASSFEFKRTKQDHGALLTRTAALFGVNAQELERDILPRCSPQRDLERLAEAVMASWSGERLVFCTSGSTGEPKECVQELAWLTQEARLLAELFRDGKRVVSLVPAHHIYGFLFTVLLPELLGVPVVDLDALSLGSLAQGLQQGDLLIAFPLLWTKCAELKIKFPAGVSGVTSTGPCPQNVIMQVQASGLSRMAEIHGSTETGGLGYRFSPSDPYRLMDHWITPARQGTIKRRHPLGKTAVGFSLPDDLIWADERCYRPAGRKDMAVQVAGVNVYPDHVRRVLIAHPKVADAAVRLMRPEEGARLKAFIVPQNQDEAPDALALELRNYVGGALSAPEIPRSYVFGPALPQNAMGKLSDWDAFESDAMKQPPA